MIFWIFVWLGFPITVLAGPARVSGHHAASWIMLGIGAVSLIGALLSVQIFGIDALHIWSPR